MASKTATIINLTLQDVSIPRAEDVINTLISVYNTDAINDKNQIVMNTSNFINDRLIRKDQIFRCETDRICNSSEIFTYIFFLIAT